jgi:hypothetical protein
MYLNETRKQEQEQEQEYKKKTKEKGAQEKKTEQGNKMKRISLENTS